MEQRTIAGRYELLEQLGASSWRATDTDLGREVLIRLPAGEIAGVTLAHPNIVRVFDQGEVDGEPFAVLEYLPGGSLEQRLAAGPLSEAESRSVAADLEDALAYAHGEGVTHGSVGPANVLLDAEGRAKLTGFAGDAEPEEDTRALGALLQGLSPEGEVTEVMQAPPAAGNRRTIALVAVAALVLLTAGVGAAFLATSDGSNPDRATGSLSIPVPTGSTEPATTQEPVVSEPATTAETTTEQQTTAPPPATTEPPPATTEPPATTAPPPPTTEPLPPPTTEAPPPATTEQPPPPTTAATTAAVTETTPG